MVVEGVHAVRVARESRRRRHVLDAHARPETVRVAERVEARLLGDSRPGQNDDAPAFHSCPTEPVPGRMTRRSRSATRLREDWGDDRRKRAGTGINKNVGRGRMPFKILTVCTGNVCSSPRSEEHTSELQSLMRISYAVFCLKNKNKK